MSKCADLATLDGFLAEAMIGPSRPRRVCWLEKKWLSVSFLFAKPEASCLPHKGVRMDSSEGHSSSKL